MRVHERKVAVLDEWWNRLMNYWPMALQRLPRVPRDGSINSSRWCVEDQGWQYFGSFGLQGDDSRGLLQKCRVKKTEVISNSETGGVVAGRLQRVLAGGCDICDVPGHGRWYAVTVIDDYARDLLACHFTWNHTATEVNIQSKPCTLPEST